MIETEGAQGIWLDNLRSAKMVRALIRSRRLHRTGAPTQFLDGVRSARVSDCPLRWRGIGDLSYLWGSNTSARPYLLSFGMII